MAKEKNEEVKKASKVLETISEDEQERIHFLSRAMWKMDRQSEYEHAKSEGIAEGRAEGREEGEKIRREKSKTRNSPKFIRKWCRYRDYCKIYRLNKRRNYEIG